MCICAYSFYCFIRQFYIVTNGLCLLEYYVLFVLQKPHPKESKWHTAHNFQHCPEAKRAHALYEAHAEAITELQEEYTGILTHLVDKIGIESMMEMIANMMEARMVSIRIHGSEQCETDIHIHVTRGAVVFTPVWPITETCADASCMHTSFITASFCSYRV